jgi:hypothetical protein
MRRGAKLSAAVYARICRAGGIPRELLADPLAASPTGIASG